MTVRGAAFLGVGSMVGAGIFALLGEAGAVAGSAVWISFLAAGTVAALQGYAVAKLGATYPSSGGIVTFLIKGFGRGHVSAVTSWLLYFAAIIVTAMVSVSFGSYGSALFFDDSTTWSKVLTIAVVLLVAVVNIAGAKFIDRVQSLIVMVLLAVFAVFIVVTLAQVDPELLAPDDLPADHGHRLERCPDILRLPGLHRHQLHRRRPARSGPQPAPGHVPRTRHHHRALRLIAVGVFGTLTVDEVVANGETALAEAAKPALGQAGFAMMAVAALLATSSSVNANIYAAAGSTAKLAETGTFPPVFGQRRPGRRHPGAPHLGGPGAASGSVGGPHRHRLPGQRRRAGDLPGRVRGGLQAAPRDGFQDPILVAAIVLTVVVLLVFAVQTLRNEPETFIAIIAILVLAVGLDLVWARMRARRTASGH